MRTSRTIGMMLVLGIAIVLPGAAVAADPPAAGQPTGTAADRAAALALVREGNRLLDQGHADQALEKFREAHRLVGGDKLRFNIAQALAGMPGHERDAYREFEQFLELVPSAAPEVTKAARGEVARLGALLAFLRVDVNPVGADVKVDGASVGAAPLAKPLVLAPGGHQLEITGGGFLPYQAAILLAPGQQRAEHVTLAPVPPPPVALAPPVVAGPRAVTAPPTAPVLAPTPPPPPAITIASQESQPANQAHAPIYGRWWFWAGVGAVALGVASAVALTRGTTTMHSCPADIPATRCFASQ
jgi:hypothetical protein